MNKEDNDLYDLLYELSDTVIHLEEINYEDLRKREVFETTNINVNSFFNQLDKKLSACVNDDDVQFVKEVALNFLIFSLKKLIVQYDCPDENIKWLSEHLKEQLIQCTREYHESNKCQK